MQHFISQNTENCRARKDAKVKNDENELKDLENRNSEDEEHIKRLQQILNELVDQASERQNQFTDYEAEKFLSIRKSIKNLFN